MNRNLRFMSMSMAALFFLTMSLGAASAERAAAEKDIAGITKRIYPSVVRVEARNGTRRIATGVVIDKDGHILTTALISPRDEKITVITADGKRIDAEFLGFDSETHLALVRAKNKGLTPLPMGKVGDINPGAWICVVSVSPEMTPAVTQGIISSVSDERLRLNIWVTPGSSGGPVVDENGRMVGLLRGIYTEDRPVVFEFRDQEQVGSGYVMSKAEAPSSGMALAVPVDIVEKIAAEIQEKGKVQRGWMGLSIAQDEDGRIEVVGVEEESPAKLAKLKEGDVIRKFGDEDVTSTPMLASEIRKRKPGEDVTLMIERDGKPMEVKVKLGEYPEAEAKRELELRFPGLFPPRPPLPPPFPVTPKDKAPKSPKGFVSPKDREFSWERRQFVGAYLDELNTEMSVYFGVKEGTGLLVNRLTDKGPAQKAGLKVGDVIVKAEGKRVETVNELSGIVQDKKKNDKIKLEILREKKPLTCDVEIEEEESGGFIGMAPFGDVLDGLALFGPEMNEGMNKLNDEFALLGEKGKSTASGLKRLVKRWAMRI
jgi:S1-C subfamily serine protease